MRNAKRNTKIATTACARGCASVTQDALQYGQIFLQRFDLLQQKDLLVLRTANDVSHSRRLRKRVSYPYCKLLIFAIGIEATQERSKLGLVSAKYRLDGRGFARICYENLSDVSVWCAKWLNAATTDLEDMEGFDGYVLGFASQQVHDGFEVLLGRNITGHYGKVGTIQKKFAKQPQRLPLSDIVWGSD